MAATAGVATKKTPRGAPKKPHASKAKKQTHPPTAQLVNEAIKTLNERGGSSLQAIKKYIAANYNVDAEKLTPYIKKYLKNAVVKGDLIQTKGKGASGSFKLSAAVPKPKVEKKKKKSVAKKAAAKKPKAAKKPAAKNEVVKKKKVAGKATGGKATTIIVWAQTKPKGAKPYRS